MLSIHLDKRVRFCSSSHYGFANKRIWTRFDANEYVTLKTTIYLTLSWTILWMNAFVINVQHTVIPFKNCCMNSSKLYCTRKTHIGNLEDMGRRMPKQITIDSFNSFPLLFGDWRWVTHTTPAQSHWLPGCVSPWSSTTAQLEPSAPPQTGRHSSCHRMLVHFGSILTKHTWSQTPGLSVVESRVWFSSVHLRFGQQLTNIRAKLLTEMGSDWVPSHLGRFSSNYNSNVYALKDSI